MAVPELVQLMTSDIPEGRRQLQESYTNLERVAQYCKDNYAQAKDKRHALEETRNFTTQSLASVAYQINTLATNFLHMLDQQQAKMLEMESSINHLSQVVTIHKEKVARREIGVLTTNKTTMRPPGIKAPGVIFPEAPERPVKYVRKSIDYSVLDHIGHGVQLASAGPQSASQRTSSTTRRSSSISSGGGGPNAPQPRPQQQAPTQRPPTPPQNQRQSSISRGGGHYRVPNVAPVAPPSLPSHYAPNYPMDPQQAAMMQQQKIYDSNRAMQAEQQRLYDANNQKIYEQNQRKNSLGDSQKIYEQHQRKNSGGHVQLSGQMRPQTPPTGVAQPMMSMGVIHQPPMMGQRQLQHQSSSMDSNYERSRYHQHQMMALRRRMQQPPPPPPNMMDYERAGNISPPLPPPPVQSVPQVQESLYSYLPGAEYRGYNQADESVNQSQVQHDDGGNVGPPQHSTPPQTRQGALVPENYIEKVIAIYDYVKDKEDELSFSENQIIYVVKKNDDGWWEGCLNGLTGLFPGNYVEPLI